MKIFNKRRLWDPLPPKRWNWVETIPEGWVPVDINLHHAIIRWMHFGSTALAEPFFSETVANLRTQGMSEIETECSVLENAGEIMPLAEPTVIIFHMSRCGSTLLSNAFKTAEDVVGISEGGPFQQAMTMAARPSQYWANRGRSLLDRLTRLFAVYQGLGRKSVFIKCACEEIATLRSLRTMWPSVPCIVLIRNPLDVLVSNLRRPPKWLNLEERRNWFGRPVRNAQFEGIVDYTAWVIGQFCTEALNALDEGCKVIDYEQLSAETVGALATGLGFNFSSEGRCRLEQVFRVHSKSNRTFQSDSDAKRNCATDIMKQSTKQWIDAPYCQLLENTSLSKQILRKGTAKSLQ